MKKRYARMDDPKLTEAVLRRIKNMTREEWLEVLAWRPENAEDP